MESAKPTDRSKSSSRNTPDVTLDIDMEDIGHVVYEIQCPIRPTPPHR